MENKKPSLMINYLKMLIFVFVLGSISALVLIGVDALTKDLIENNKKVELYSTILDHNKESYTVDNLIELFESGEVIQIENYYYNEDALVDLFKIYQEDEYTYFINNQNDDLTVYYEDVFAFGPGGNDSDTVGILIVLKDNLSDVVRLDVIHDGDESYWGKRDLLIDDVLKQVNKLPLSSLLDVDETAKVTKTNESLFNSINDHYPQFKKPDVSKFTLIDLDKVNLSDDLIESVVTSNELDLKDYIELTGYRHLATRNLSFEFRGNALWGPIYGIMTLKEDLLTIVDVSVLEQEETPGLGAVVGERIFLDTLIGKIFNPGIRITKNPTGDSEVDQLTGATSTSGSFQIILNNAQDIFYTKIYGPRQDGIRDIMSKILLAHNISFSDTDDLNKLITNNFTISEKNDLTLYTHKTSKAVSFVFEEELRFGQNTDVIDEVTIIVSLESDFETILNLAVIHDKVDAHWGKTRFLTEDNLANAVGKKFPNVKFIYNPTTQTGEHEIDNLAESSTIATQIDFENALNEYYSLYLETFKELPNLNSDMMKDILLAHEIEFTQNNFRDVFEENFQMLTKNDLVVYKLVNNTGYTYVVNSNVRFSNGGADLENVTILVSLEGDFKTIKDLTVYLQESEKTQWGKRDFLTLENLANAVGKKFPNISFVKPEEGEELADNEVDNLSQSSTPHTISDFEQALNDSYNLYYSAFGGNK